MFDPSGRMVLVTGGGYGDPLERDRGRVADHVEQGFVSPSAAREIYGATP